MKTLRQLALLFALPLAIAVIGIVTAGARPTDAFNAAATYKSKCVACHGAKAEKKFDKTKSDADNVQLILKGKKMPKPPHMPAYADKGITEEQATALLDYMKSLQP